MGIAGGAGQLLLLLLSEFTPNFALYTIPGLACFAFNSTRAF